MRALHFGNQFFELGRRHLGVAEANGRFDGPTRVAAHHGGGQKAPRMQFVVRGARRTSQRHLVLIERPSEITAR